MTDTEKPDEEECPKRPNRRGSNETPAPETTIGAGSGRVRWLPQTIDRWFSRRETR